jgi:hypothetical protein
MGAPKLSPGKVIASVICAGIALGGVVCLLVRWSAYDKPKPPRILVGEERLVAIREKYTSGRKLPSRFGEDTPLVMLGERR